MRMFAVIPVVIFGGLAMGLGLGLGQDPRELPSMLSDRKLVSFSLPDLAGSHESLESIELQGDKITLLNVFASWCGGCRFEHPMLMNVARDSRIDLVGVNWKDNQSQVSDWIKQHGNPYRIIGEDASGRTGDDLGVTGVPETFVIDHEGRVRYRHAGPLTPEIWNSTIEPVIAEIEARS